MYNIFIRYFDGPGEEYENISKIVSSIYGELSDNNILLFLPHFKGNLYLFSKKTTYIVSCDNVQSIEINKD